MESAHTTRIGASQNGAKKPSSRSKRELIIATATADFARVGYRASKWSDVADSVGIGSTALYHYFVSKDHCLFTIMARSFATTGTTSMPSAGSPATAHGDQSCDALSVRGRRRRG